MKERYLTLPAAIVEDEDVKFCDVRINPFSIDFYFEAEIEYENEEGSMAYFSTTRITTRTGNEIDIMMSIEEFEKQVFA